ncbi:MAG: ATP-binding cassette domain-containing protein, partial [Symbiobacteriaceae bacterium]|nr:ATP-binding cassette domain-containing protein [Symbiobacteriaceae bacterium]
FTMFLLYINTFLNPIYSFWSFFERLQSGMTGFRRVLEIMDLDAEEESAAAIAVPQVRGQIEFVDVSFSYTEKPGPGEEEDADNPLLVEVISHLNLSIPQGSTTALVGPSGGGKTTLCHLLPRFYNITSGSICIDGRDIREFTLDSLRSHIGIVAQDVFLFTGTIRENIAYGRLDASEEEIVVAAKQAKIHDHISSLPEGYGTFIGERGVKLSGGQKQRLAIARVFLKNPSILILDEATSALDNATEMLIQEALEELAKGRTTIVVAHRLSTIKKADEIVVLTPQGITERGSHEELLAADGLYASLYRHQFA